MVRFTHEGLGSEARPTGRIMCANCRQLRLGAEVQAYRDFYVCTTTSANAIGRSSGKKRCSSLLVPSEGRMQ